MKKLFICLLSALALSGCFQKRQDTSLKPLQEEVKLNNPNADIANYILQTEDLEKVTMDDVSELIENKESGYIFIGYAQCPWCADVITPLMEVVRDRDVDLKYLDASQSFTQEQINRFNNNLSTVLTDGKLYVPLLISIKDGEIVASHRGTLDGHNAKERELFESEVSELKELLIKVLE